jgi:cytochrome b561
MEVSCDAEFLLVQRIFFFSFTHISCHRHTGKGLPFFYKTIPGAETPNGQIAKNAFNIHKTLGTYGKYLVPLHVSASGLHFARGQSIFQRINPFRTPRA